MLSLERIIEHQIVVLNAHYDKFWKKNLTFLCLTGISFPFISDPITS